MTDAITLSQYTQVLSVGTGALLLLSAAMGLLFLWQARGRTDAQLETDRGLQRIDGLGCRTVMLGFPLLTAALVLGRWSASESWGASWAYGSPLTRAFITWLGFLGYVHLRLVAGWRGRRSAWFLAAGGAAMFITFLLFGCLPDDVARSQHGIIG